MGLQRMHPAEKMIIDCVKAHPGEVTILCLGPLTNLAKAFQRDPSLPGQISRIIMTGGTLCGIGNITPAAEFNFFLIHTARERF